MSEYRRLISYLYTYNNGLKNKNVGFAKVERKNGMIRLWINMKESFLPGEKFGVYFFVRRGDAIAGIEMGGLEIKGGAGEFKSACREEELAADFEELCGLYIKGDLRNKMFASQWDDRDFSVDKIVLLKDVEPEAAPPEPSEVPLAKEAYIPEGIPSGEAADGEPPLEKAGSEAKAEDKAENKAETEAEIPVWKRPIKEEVYVSRSELNAQAVEESKEQEDAGQKDSEPENTGRGNIERETLRIAEETRREQAESEISRCFDGKDPVLVFSEDEIYDCVDITLDDLVKLPQRTHGLMNNSFVNHGYYNFRHLLLGKKDGDILVVGVPGIYNRREKMTAAMFGFDKFKFSMRGDVRVNHFGYWYKEF